MRDGSCLLELSIYKSALHQTRPVIIDYTVLNRIVMQWSVLWRRVLHCSLHQLYAFISVGNRVDAAHPVDALQLLRNVSVPKLSHKVVELIESLLEGDFAVVAIEVVPNRWYSLGHLTLIKIALDDVDNVAYHVLLGHLSPDWMVTHEVSIHPNLSYSPLVYGDVLLLNGKRPEVMRQLTKPTQGLRVEMQKVRIRNVLNIC